MSYCRECLLLIFIKNPERGKVKTRLAVTLGDKKALSIYEKLLSHTRQVTHSLKVAKQLWYSDFIPEKDGWPQSYFKKKLQQGDDLGRRMQFAFEDGFKSGYKKIVIIGGDCAELQTVHIKNAFKALENNEAVIGPANDGGYYLLGLKRPVRHLFKNKQWGTGTVFEKTIMDFEKQSISYELLEELRDIDTEEDWEKVKGLFV